MVRTVKHPDARRQEFVATAQQLFFSKGYENTSVNDIIQAVGLSKGAFYHYFASKQALLEAVTDGLLDQSLVNMQAIVADPTLDAIAKFNQLMQNQNSWKLAQKDHMLAYARMLFMDENLRLRHRLQTEGRLATVALLSEVVAQGVAEGVFAVADAAISAEFAFAIIHTTFATFNELMLSQPPDNAALPAIQTKVELAHAAIERLLSAPAGSISLIDADALAAWFAPASEGATP